MNSRSVLTLALVAAVCTIAAPPARGDNAAKILKKALVGRQIVVPFDTPVSAYGVDFKGDDSLARDDDSRFERIDMWGLSIRGGETATITDVRVSKKRIELLLGRGGLSTTDLMRLNDPEFNVGGTAVIPEDQSAHGTHVQARRADNDRISIGNELGGSSERSEYGRELRASTDTLGTTQKERLRRRAWVYRPGLGSRLRLLYKDQVPAEMLDPETFVAAMSEHVLFKEPAGIGAKESNAP